MKNAIVKMRKNSETNVWEQDKLPQIKNYLNSLIKEKNVTLSDSDFKKLCVVGELTNLNPFLGEIWAIKYKQNEPAQIFASRDGFRVNAQRQPDYDYHYSQSLYTNDEFEYNHATGVVVHKPNLKDRGVLYGAYAVLKRKGSSLPFFKMVLIKDYRKPYGNWKTMEDTMIQKVAEAQVLKMGYQEIFPNTYDISEAWDEAQYIQFEHAHKQQEIAESPKIEHLPADHNKLLFTLKCLIEDTQIDEKTVKTWCERANIDALEQMQDEHLIKCIDFISKKRSKTANEFA